MAGGATCDLTSACGCELAEPVNLAAWWRVAVGAVVAANAMTVSLALSASDPTPGERAAINAVLAALAVLSIGLLGWPLARNAWRALRRRRVAMEGLFLTGIVGAAVASAIAAVTGEGESYFEIVCLLLVVYTFGQQLVTGAEGKALRAVTAWSPDTTTCTLVTPDGSERKAAVAEVRAGDRVRVAPGETIPVDGVVESGGSFVREAEMTGEPAAVVRGTGDRVWASTHAVDGMLVVRATVDGRSRRIDRIVDAVERARAVPSSLQSQADRVVAWLLPGAVAVAIATFAAWTAASGWRDGLFNAMSVLLVACPCAFGLATPLAVWAAVGRLASRGLVVRGGDVLERTAALDVLVFDKTGTLTEPETTLVDVAVRAAAGCTASGAAAAVAAVERVARHPVGAALADLGDPAGWRVVELTVLPAVGVSALVEDPDGRGMRVEVGAAERLAGPDDPRWRELLGRLRAPEWSRRVVASVDGEPALAAAVDERLRSSWPEALAALAGMGLTTVVLTGDRAERARLVAAHEVASGLDPEAKLARVRGMRAAGRRVGFVGDGVNDAAAMAEADVSVGVATGAELAAETADVTWWGGDLRALPWAVDLARSTVKTVRGSLLFAVAYNLVGVGLAVAGLLHPVAAAILMTCSSLVVTWRATATLQQDQEEEVARAGVLAEEVRA